ncbi:PilT family plasmid conjugative transfer putative membrane protein [Buttiauxella noackiae ATCC 51607]|uniref:PilT family plasmid conjugative transfer putative membrane protein n=1 Tax=Buttiauxella noackiae ATCC 51607 TaxID=1354255 RepID=A0A1B7HGE5_9ENTR|nr:lytic transglycosylase domain-containing protein [Buttiauxella noackiae]OAT14685.1 PilT family plasmid conjugative transfer putative membrane protein [Buttiauxella noackiae ATCC 51607]
MNIIFGALTTLLLTAVMSLPAQAFCFNEAGARYQIDPRLLQAIARQESSLNPKAVNINRNKAGKVVSRDYGIMQVNDTHVPRLIRMGVLKSKEELLTNPCLNVQIGAWVLANHLQVCGISWSCLGSYNAGFATTQTQETRRMNYARKIYDRYRRELGQG